MIYINLVPENLRKKKVGLPSVRGFHLPREVVLALVGGLVAFLVVIHVVLQSIIFLRLGQLVYAQQAMKSLAAPKKDVDEVLQELRKLQASLKLIEDISKNRRLYWAPKLNAISDNTTRGVWLEQMSFREKKFSLSGSAVSKSASEMLEANNFINKLKNDKVFTKDFGAVETGPIKTHKVNTTTVADFTVTATVK